MAKPNLLEAMKAKTAPPRLVTVAAETQERSKSKRATANPAQRESRVGKSLIGGWYPDAVHKQFRMMAVEEDTTIQRLLAEAMNDLLAKRGKPESVPLDSE